MQSECHTLFTWCPLASGHGIIRIVCIAAMTTSASRRGERPTGLSGSGSPVAAARRHAKFKPSRLSSGSSEEAAAKKSQTFPLFFHSLYAILQSVFPAPSVRPSLLSDLRSLSPSSAKQRRKETREWRRGRGKPSSSSALSSVA